MLLLLTNKKSYMGLPLVPKSVTLSDLERQNVRRAYQKSAITRKRCKLEHMLPIIFTIRKSHTVFRLVPKSMTLVDFELRNGYYIVDTRQLDQCSADLLAVAELLVGFRSRMHT